MMPETVFSKSPIVFRLIQGQPSQHEKAIGYNIIKKIIQQPMMRFVYRTFARMQLLGLCKLQPEINGHLTLTINSSAFKLRA